MALAEPRRRQKWTLNPRGNLWANDTDKFGQKLMEKMGWEQGKGLGVRQDGMVDPVKLRQKDNNKGIGFEGHDDTWLAHQEDFQAVLAALNAEHSNSNSNDGTEDMEEIKQKSLEATSKVSRARVHYQKFTRGKDLANYSKDDLGCILGTKSEKMKKKKKKSKDQEKEEKSEVSEVGSQEKSHGLVMIKGGSYQEYFAKKMAELKAKGRTTYGETGTVRTEEVETYEETQIVGFKMDTPEVQDEHEEQPTDELPAVVADTDISSKKKKKKKKSKEEAEQESAAVVPVPNEEIEQDESEKKKKKKNKKDKNKETEESEEQNLEEQTKKSKKKKSKDQHPEPEDAPVEMEGEKQKKKKNKKGKREKNSDLPEPADVVDSGCEGEEVKEKKKKKGKKEKKHDEQERKRKHDDDITTEEPTKKKRKKSAETEDADNSLGFRGSNLHSINGYGH